MVDCVVLVNIAPYSMHSKDIFMVTMATVGIDFMMAIIKAMLVHYQAEWNNFVYSTNTKDQLAFQANITTAFDYYFIKFTFHFLMKYFNL